MQLQKKTQPSDCLILEGSNILFTESLLSFTLIVLLLDLKDAGAIFAIGTSITGLLGAAIYGNVKVHQHKNGTG